MGSTGALSLWRSLASRVTPYAVRRPSHEREERASAVAVSRPLSTPRHFYFQAMSHWHECILKAHSYDPERIPYTFAEFLDFAQAQGMSPHFGWQMWREADAVTGERRYPRCRRRKCLMETAVLAGSVAKVAVAVVKFEGSENFRLAGPVGHPTPLAFAIQVGSWEVALALVDLQARCGPESLNALKDAPRNEQTRKLQERFEASKNRKLDLVMRFFPEFIQLDLRNLV